MKTSPAFQFYPADFIGGTMLMSAAEVGAYIRLLCYQWQQGGIPSDPLKIEKIAGMKSNKLDDVLTKFLPNESGDLQNPRMENLRIELGDFRELAKAGGRASGSKRVGNSEWGKQMAAKRQRTGSLESNEQATNSDATNRANSHTQSQSQPHNTANAVSPKPPEGAGQVLALRADEVTSLKPVDPIKARVASWFQRRPTTAWTAKEIDAFTRNVADAGPGDLDALERYYTATIATKDDYRRRDLSTLLNNWPGELDRARRYTTTHKHDDRAF